MRLDKFLCACQVGTRSEVKKIIKQKKVTINGVVALRPETGVDEHSDVVCCGGKQLCYEEYLYYVLYKTKGCVTATVDARHPTVMSLLPEELQKLLTPVGRLDLDTEGLLLMTNDGEFTHHILSPSHHVPKTYLARLDASVPATAVNQFEKGVNIGDDTLTKPAQLEILPDEVNPDGLHSYYAKLTISEGRYHQVKRMFHAVGCEVIGLNRLSIGTLTTEGMQPGDYRKLTTDEVNYLKAK